VANFTYLDFLHRLGLGDFDLSAADWRVMLVMTNTTADTEDDAGTIDDFTTLDEYDGTPYTRQALANEVYEKVAASNLSRLRCDPSTFTTLGVTTPGARQVAGALIYIHVTDDTDSVPAFWYDQGGFPFTPSGLDLVLNYNATDGFGQLRGVGNP
jgi:hypothetical protein